MTRTRILPPPPFSPLRKLLVAVSGGSDSLGLLCLLDEELPRARQRIIAAHVNYGLRGAASDADERRVLGFCGERNIPLKVFRVRWDGKGARKLSQDKARELRYGFFRRLVLRTGAWGVAVAHHQEDQAETVLDRLLRGSGPRGLSGLRQVQALRLWKRGGPLRVWRPLLNLSKGEIRDMLRERAVPWREDASNRTNTYRRNQIRHRVIPYLSKWNPNLIETLSRAGTVLGDEDQAMDLALEASARSLEVRRGKRTFSCRAAAFRRLPGALRRRWVRKAAEGLTEKARGLSFDRIERTIRWWDGPEGGPWDLGYGLSAERREGRALLHWKG